MKIHIGLMVVCMSALLVCAAFAADGAKTWNEAAANGVIQKESLAKLSPELPEWKIKQMAWPTPAEIAAHKAEASREEIDAAVAAISKVMNTAYIPADLAAHITAMKAWGTHDEPARQERLMDAFVVRYSMEGQTVQIQESPCNIVITVAPEARDQAPAANKEQYILDVAGKVLNPQVAPDPASPTYFNTAAKESPVIKRVGWIPAAAVVQSDPETKTFGTSWKKTVALGISDGAADSDGRFVRFDLLKPSPGPKRGYPDPNVERFSKAPAK